MMDDVYARSTGRLAIGAGLVAAGTPVCLATYFAFGGPFGTINDIGNAATGLLGAALALRLRRHVSARSGDLAIAAAIAGAAITVVGSALVISGTTGFLLAGLVSSVGFAGIGMAVRRSRKQRISISLSMTSGWLRRNGMNSRRSMTTSSQSDIASALAERGSLAAMSLSPAFTTRRDAA
jgi:hypothetical protein